MSSGSWFGPGHYRSGTSHSHPFRTNDPLIPTYGATSLPRRNRRALFGSSSSRFGLGELRSRTPLIDCGPDYISRDQSSLLLNWADTVSLKSGEGAAMWSSDELLFGGRLLLVIALVSAVV
jgi:hypothetical protein